MEDVVKLAFLKGSNMGLSQGWLQNRLTCNFLLITLCRQDLYKMRTHGIKPMIRDVSALNPLIIHIHSETGLPQASLLNFYV